MTQIILTCPECKKPSVEKTSPTFFRCYECKTDFHDGSLEYEKLNNRYKKYQPDPPPRTELILDTGHPDYKTPPNLKPLKDPNIRHPTRCPNCNKSLVEESYHHSDGRRSRQYVCDDCDFSIPDFKHKDKVTPSGYQVCPVCSNKKCYYIKDNNEFYCWNCSSIFKQDDPRFAQLIQPKPTPSHTFTPKYTIDGKDAKAKTDKLQNGLSLIPYFSILAIGRIFVEGLRYGKENWLKGVNDKEFQEERLAHALEHLFRWKEGDRSEEHLAKVAWFCVTQLELERRERLEQSKANQKDKQSD